MSSSESKEQVSFVTEDPKQARRTLYPQIEPFQAGRLKVSDIVRL
jgi:hypothetical protein